MELPHKFIFILLILIATFLEVIGDVYFKSWSIHHKNSLLLIGLLIYFVGTVFWALSLKYEYLSKAIALFTIINLIAIVLVGMLYFKEELTLVNKLGILLGIASIILIEA